MDQLELFDAYIEQNRMWHFEGHRGVQRLEKIVDEVCDYGSLTEFLADNPGAMEAVVNWIREANCLEWRQNLEELVAEEEDAE
jgi:hypothetical protein